MQKLPNYFTTYTTTRIRFQVLVQTLNGPACPFVNKVPQQRSERFTFPWWKTQLVFKLAEKIEETVKAHDEGEFDENQVRIVLWYCMGELIKDIIKMMRLDWGRAEAKQDGANKWRLCDFFFHLVEVSCPSLVTRLT